MKRRPFLAPWPWLLTLALAGCVPPPEGACDPRIAGIATAAACDVGGRYDERRLALQTRLGDQEAALDAAREEAQRAAERAAALTLERRLLEERLAVLDDEIRRAGREIGAQWAAAARDRAEAERLEVLLRELEERRGRARADQAVVEAEIQLLVREVEQRRRALQDALEAMVPQPGTASAASP